MITQFDAIDVSQIPEDAQAVAGYVGGSWPTFSSLAAKFPRALLLSVAVTAAEDAQVLDVEQGDATVGDVPGWLARQAARGVWRPCVYASASVMGAVVAAVTAAGWKPAAVRLWSAHYGAGEHVCGPSTCGIMHTGADGTQWTSSALGRNLDQSLMKDDFYGGTMTGELGITKYGTACIPAGSSTGIWLFADPTVQGRTAQAVRVAVHSAAKGYDQIHVVNVDGSAFVPFTEKDVDGVSLARTDPEINWAPVAYHF